ncbi:hypothetical protein [Psychroserpens mesophilus]|uniref:hypothetical protein n=1 Tax=Psychroserpens mesophilus TaxID=325473 RepID=UPI003D646FF9
MYLKKILFLLALGFISVCFSQSRIYLDHNGEDITQQEAKNLIRNKFIIGKTYIKGVDTISKLTLTDQFGKISDVENSQIRSLLSQRTSTKLLNNDYIVIVYIDTLHNYQSYIQNLKNEFRYNLKLDKRKIDLLKRKEQLKIKERGFRRLQIKKFKKWEKFEKKIEKQYKAKVFHVSNINNIVKPIENKLKWIHNNSVIKQKFLDYDVGNRIIIIKPDGSFYMTYGLIQNVENELLKNHNWSELENQLFELLKDNSLYENHDVFYTPLRKTYKR